MTWSRALVAVALLTVVAGPATAQRGVSPAPTRTAPQAPVAAGCEPSVAALRQLAANEWTKNHDADAVLAAVDAAIGEGSKDFIEFVDSSAEGLLFTVSFPQRYYRWALSEALRKRDPISSVFAPSNVMVEVAVTKIDAPNIEKVIVERGGRSVAPLSGALSPTTQVTRLGARAVLNEGHFAYSCSTFFPGAPVRVIGIPSSGYNFVREFDDRELERFTGRKLQAPKKAADLLGMRLERATEFLPDNSTFRDTALGYSIEGGGVLYVTVTNGVVASVSDGSVALARLRPPANNTNLSMKSDEP
jgi:hypothetical protein